MCVTYAGTASASSIVTITTSRHQLQNTRAFLKSNSSDRSDKCHSRESIDLALSSFCFQKCQILAVNASSGYSSATKKKKTDSDASNSGQMPYSPKHNAVSSYVSFPSFWPSQEKGFFQKQKKESK